MQKIQHLCDLCFLHNKETAAGHLGVPFGIERNQMLADLCNEHYDELNLALDPFFQVGRRPEAIVAPKVSRPGKGGPKPTPPGDFECPVGGCSRSFTSHQGVSMHLTRVHAVPGVAEYGLEAHNAAIRAASASDVAPPTAGSGSMKRVITEEGKVSLSGSGGRAGMTAEALEDVRARDRDRKARKRQERADALAN